MRNGTLALALKLAMILLSLLWFGDQALAQSDQMSAAQCATDFTKTSNRLKQCLSGDVTETSPWASFFYIFNTDPFGPICKQLWEQEITISSPPDLLDLGAMYSTPCMEIRDSVFQRRKNDPSFDSEVREYFVKHGGYEICEKEAEEKFAALSKQCKASAPSLFSSSCTWTRTIASVCHTNCSGQGCTGCSRYDLELEIGCGININVPARAARGSPPFCQDAANAGSECRKRCSEQSENNRSSCVATCNASEKTAWDACWIALGMTPPPLEDLPGVSALPSSLGGKNIRPTQRAKIDAVGVSVNKKKPLPPNPCRDGASCSRTSSAGVASSDPGERSTNSSLRRQPQDRGPDQMRESRGRSEAVNDRGRDAAPSRLQGDSPQASRSDQLRSTQSDRPNRSPLDLERMAPMRTETPRLR